MKKKLVALLLSAVVALGTVTPDMTASAATTPCAITVDFSDYSDMDLDNVYGLDEKIHNIEGTVADASKVASMTYEIKDAAGIVIKSGKASVSKKNGKFKISKAGYVLGVNYLTFTVKTVDDEEYTTSYTIYNEEEKNVDNADIDTNDDDNDGVINYWEQYYGLDQDNADTDGDGLNDYVELYTTSTQPLLTDSDFDGIADADEDEDADGMTNAEEVAYGSNPLMSDSDTDGLNDSEEKALGTDANNADTDDDNASDGFEVANGYDPLVKGGTFYYTLTAGDASLALKANGSAVDSIEFEEADITVAGGVSNAISTMYEVSADTLWKTASISVATEDASATFYSYDADSQTLTKLATTVADGKASASLTEAGYYVLVSGDVVMGEASDSDVTLDSNKDGITDVDTLRMVEGKLLTGTGAKVFGDATYSEIQANADFDGDGLTNGSEIEIKTNEDGTEYVFLNSSPAAEDTDADGITDDKDTAEFTYGLAGGVVGRIQLVARFEDMKLSYDEDGNLVLDEDGNPVSSKDIFFTGHSWFVFTSYVDNEEYTLNEVNRSYAYDETAYSTARNEQGAYVQTSLNSENGATYTLNRGDYFSVGNYRTKQLDVIYDLVMGNSDDLVDDLELNDIFDRETATTLDVAKYAATEEGYARISNLLNSSLKSSIRYNEEIYDTYECCSDYSYEFDNGIISQDVTQDALEEIMAYDNAHNYYNLFVNNCSSISSAAWNIVCEANGNEDLKVNARGEGIYSLIDTPMTLKKQIKAMEGGVIYSLDKNNATEDGKVVYATPEICKSAFGVAVD